MSSPHSILALTQGVALGDHACFDALHTAWNPIVQAWIRRTIPKPMHEAHAADIEQEVWIRVIRRLRPIDADLRFERWLRSVTLNAARDRIRQELRRTRRERAPRSASDNTTSPDPQQALLMRERFAQLTAALQGIDQEAARLIDLRMRTDATLDRLGGLVGLTPGALDGRVRRSLKALRQSQPDEPPRTRPKHHPQAAPTATLTDIKSPASTGGQAP